MEMVWAGGEGEGEEAHVHVHVYGRFVGMFVDRKSRRNLSTWGRNG